MNSTHFLSMPHSCCEAINANIRPEFGADAAALDSKLSTGYAKQFEHYKMAAKMTTDFYLVVVISDMGWGDEQLVDAKNPAAMRGELVSGAHFVDEMPRPAANVE